MEIRCPLLGGSSPTLDRRAFLSRSATLGVLAALAGSCSPSPFGPELGGPLTVSLSDYPELAVVDGVARVRGTDAPIALVNVGGGTYLALSLVCPHQGGQISWRGTAFVCSAHGATFAEDGQWIGGHSAGPMRLYGTSYDAVAGTVTIAP
jgi:Rieske Fe-S protein